MLARVTLEDLRAARSGSKVTSLKPFELVAVQGHLRVDRLSQHDRGRAGGVRVHRERTTRPSPTASTRRRAWSRRIGPSCCRWARRRPAGRDAPRAFVAPATPALAARSDAAPRRETKQFHGVYVRHPDMVRCTRRDRHGRYHAVSRSPPSRPTACASSGRRLGGRVRDRPARLGRNGVHLRAVGARGRLACGHHAAVGLGTLLDQLHQRQRHEPGRPAVLPAALAAARLSAGRAALRAAAAGCGRSAAPPA